MHPSIRVQQLGKRYRLGATVSGRRNLTEDIAGAGRRLWQALRGQRDAESTEFWALDNVSFDIDVGEVVGIVGRNGAGKSTLLKILARIVSPTTGRVEIRGRVGSLLEVGTGFHPELTGRENVYLNGSMLGMTRREISAKFDQIEEFSGISRFLDTPVKRYSSGMYVRLAFAVAAHFEPEILIVDEVLAVGDASFQRRCIDRMTQLARSGRTILFVSHNLHLIQLLCERAVLLERGRIASVGATATVLQRYFESTAEEATSGDLRNRTRSGDGRARFTRIWLVNESGDRNPNFVFGRDLTVRMEVESLHDLQDVSLAVVVATQSGSRILSAWTKEMNVRVDLDRGTRLVECRFRHATLRHGHTFLIHLWMSQGDVIDSVENALLVEVHNDEASGHLSPDAFQGEVVLPYEWRLI